MIKSKLSPIAIKGGGSSLSLLCVEQIAKWPECWHTRAAAVGVQRCHISLNLCAY